MCVIWRKVLRDLWRNKSRTLLVVLSTTMGVAALGFVFGLSDVLNTRLTESHRASIPAHIAFYVSQFDQEVVDQIKHQPGVLDAEGQAGALLRWRLENETEWRNGTIIARPDYDEQRIGRFDWVEGQWPHKRMLTAERLTASSFRTLIGTTIVFEMGRSERRLGIGGIARHPEAAAPPLGDAIFFATPETLAWLTNRPEGFDQLLVRMEGFDENGAKELAEQIKHRLVGMGLIVGGYGITKPQEHPAQQSIDAIKLILAVLGVLAMGLSAFLITNMMNALIAQQVWQIGVLKVIGASSWRIARVYLATALAYGLFALILAVPLGAVTAYVLANVLLNLFNVPAGNFYLSPIALVVQAAVSLLVPILAALMPVMGAARITPHQAISSYGLAGGFGKSWLDRWVGLLHGLPRPLMLTLRNTFRRKTRVALTMITLVLGGMMFIVILSINASMNLTLEVLLSDFGFDAVVVFDRMYRIEPLVEVAKLTPAVTHAEVWDRRGIQIVLPKGGDRDAAVWGVAAGSRLFIPRIVDGRALLPEDDRAILLNSKIADEEGFKVGDEIKLKLGDRESTWTIVGVILNVNNAQQDNFVNYEALARAMGTPGRGAVVVVASQDHDSLSLQNLVGALRTTFKTNNMEPSYIQSADEARQANKVLFNAVTLLMLVMAVLAAMVGSIGLMSTMSINVVERGREIGVMRAIGASSAKILGMFVTEGVLVGALSWLFAVPISYPSALVFNNLVGTTLFRLPLNFDFSLMGVGMWLGIVVVLSGLASLWPALRATRVSVREALTYE